MIKYLGSKRLLVPVLGELLDRIGAGDALDLFTGTTRVAQEFKKRGAAVTAVDLATYSKVMADCYIASDADALDIDAIQAELDRLNSLPGVDGYVTDTFCERSRFFQPHNGRRIDAIREAIEQDHPEGPLRSILLTSLLLAADRVDSTTGLQMAYLKQWSPRSYHDLELLLPDLISGTGRAVLGDATQLVEELPAFEVAYLDPPYNQHRYFTNYHVWESLIRWDKPDHYGVACKRLDARGDGTRSVFNSKPQMPPAFAHLLSRLRAEVVVVSYNDESWITREDMIQALRAAGHEEVAILDFDTKRYVGAQIGIHSPSGKKVGEVKKLRNVEQLFVAGDRGLLKELAIDDLAQG